MATIALVGGVLMYKTSSAPRQFRIATAGASPNPGPSPSPAASAPATATGSPAPAGASSTGRTGTYTGPVETNQFGPVQVQVTVAGGKLTDVKTLVLPNDRPRSAYISSVAGPLLTQETLKAQSTNINNVSGASYTSYSFYKSLQVALTKAGM